MNNIIDVVNNISRKEKELKERVLNYFDPLCNLYVTKIVGIKEIPRKLFGITFSIDETPITEYCPLIIKVIPTLNNVTVSITAFSDFMDFTINKEFPISLFDKNDYTISHTDTVKEFVQKIMNSAYPIYLKYEAFVNHISDKEKKWFVASKLHQFLNSDEFKNNFKTGTNIDNCITRLKILEWELEWELEFDIKVNKCKNV